MQKLNFLFYSLIITKFCIYIIIICAREAKADIGLPVTDDDYDYDNDNYDPGIKCTKLA